MTPTFAFLSPLEIGVLVGVAVLLFGADRIPKLARSIGHAKKEFESAQRGDASQPSTATPSNEAATPPVTTPPPAAPQP